MRQVPFAPQAETPSHCNHEVVVWQPDPDGTGREKTVSDTYKVLRPLTAYSVNSAEEGSFAIQLNVTPIDGTNCTAWMCTALNYAQGASHSELWAYQDKSQDWTSPSSNHRGWNVSTGPAGRDAPEVRQECSRLP